MFRQHAHNEFYRIIEMASLTFELRYSVPRTGDTLGHQPSNGDEQRYQMWLGAPIGKILHLIRHQYLMRLRHIYY